MNEAFKIVAYAICGGVLTLFLNSYRKEYALICAMVTCILILSTVVTMLSGLVSKMYELSNIASLRLDYITLIIRAVGIAYLMEFACELLKDSGAGAIAKKVELTGKIIILYMAFPIITEFMEVCINAINSM